MGDAMSLTAMAVFLHGRGREYRVRGGRTTTLAELREGAAVLFGAFSKDCTLRENKDLRFHGALDPHGWRYLEDRHDLASRRWKGTHGNVLPPAEYVDYAVTTRVFEQTTGHPVTSVEGITHLGTLAAGEFLLSPEAMGEALRDAPPGWEAKNLQIVVSTNGFDKIVRGPRQPAAASGVARLVGSPPRHDAGSRYADSQEWSNFDFSGRSAWAYWCHPLGPPQSQVE